jgi:Cu+-exporting ATPase
MMNLPLISFLNIKKHPINYGITLLVLTIPFIIFGFDIIKSGITKLIHRNPNMDSLVTIGVIESLTYSLVNLILIILGDESLVKHLYFESAAMILYFIKIGRYIEKNSKEKTKEAIKELVQITPQSAIIKTKIGEKEVTIDEIKKGDILICKPGMKVAVDGIIVKGETHLDESFITGESNPAKKKENDRVVAGSMNINGYIEYKAERIGPESTISEIVRLVVESANTKVPIQRIADKVSGIFVPSIIIIAFLTLITYLIIGSSINESIISFVTVLVVACPCALGLATPLALVVSIGTSSKNGILIKQGEILENTNRIDTVVFDKTGTLTYGKLSVSQFNNYSNYSNEELLRIVACIEHNSTHPIGTAFKEYYDSKMTVSDFNNMPGIGVSGIIKNKMIYIGNPKMIKKLNIDSNYDEEEKEFAKNNNSIIYVVEEKRILDLIGVKDIVRESSKDTIQELKNMNKEIIILSGDNEQTVNNIAQELGIKRVIANVLPNEKEKVLKKLKEDNHKVMMIGDGINDAPSLASADIGVSLSSGTDIAGDSADVILIQNDLSKIVSLFNISKKTRKVVKQNLFWAFIYNIIMIPIAIGLLKPFGITLVPMLASLFMMISSLTVVLNSLRLNKI